MGERTPERKLPEAGDLVAGKYRIERVIGEGGMGRVFAAHHEVLDQRVAVKLLFAEVAERPNVVERFLREAKSTARLKSAHVARVMDAGMTESGLPFLVMECLEGCDLMELLRLSGPLPLVDVVDYILQGLEGIAHAHAAGIVHRDLKPSNLFLALLPDGSNAVKLLDFGISKSIARSGAEVATLTGQNIMGSPAYMSPEQIRNAKMVDPRSDLWSLGVVMYELLTGKLPFRGDGVGELLAAVLEQEPIPLRARRADVPEGVEAAVHKALRRIRDARFASAAEMARALSPWASPRWARLADDIEQLLAHAVQTAETVRDVMPDRDEASSAAMLRAEQVTMAHDGSGGLAVAEGTELQTLSFPPAATEASLDQGSRPSGQGLRAVDALRSTPTTSSQPAPPPSMGSHRARTAVIGGSLVAVALVALLVARGLVTRSSSPAASAAPATGTSLTTAPTPSPVEGEGPAPEETVLELDDDEGDSGVILRSGPDVPRTTPRPGRSPGRHEGRPGRPKVLQSRE